ncbi:DUF4350 domain-containing protein [Hymenobacter sp. BT730]|uniref:DUF4350 domain-containing protein n=1 Tax=Hymenobacter sp. BT730 TaxID=3063332 RepID=UPI0026E04714|nr:DUF4350 domain-containing protein [Hymenobacter sp. BT730]
MTTFRWYLLGLTALFAAYVTVEYYRPKPLDWTPTYQNKDKIPYGTYVLYDLLPELMQVNQREVTAVRVPVYTQLYGNAPTEAAQVLDSSKATPAPTEPALPPTAKATYLFINKDFSISPTDSRALLRHVAQGNQVFIAAEEFSKTFQDTLGFTTAAIAGNIQFKKGTPQDWLADSVSIHFTNAGLRRAAGAAFYLPQLGASYRIQPDSTLAGATQLAAAADGQPVLVRIPHGRGAFFICTLPQAFTNYFVLQPRTHNLAFAALSYLPSNQAVWWDEYQKQGPLGEQSLLRVLMAHDALRWAYYLLLVSALLFVVIEARRRQRVIPVLKPLPNTTLLFTRTVASLYQQGGNHERIAEKKINLFLEFLRTRFQETSTDLNDEAFRERLAQKAGMPRSRIDELIRRIHFARTAPTVTDQQLLLLSRSLAAFRRDAR